MADRGGQYSDLADSLFDEFNTRFWLRPGNNLKVASLYIRCLSLLYFLFQIQQDNEYIEQMQKQDQEEGEGISKVNILNLLNL